MSLPELAEGNSEVREVLEFQENSHTEAAQIITEMGYPTSESSVRRWRREQQQNPETFTPYDRAALHGKLDELLDETNADPGSVVGMRLATWDSMVKNAAKQAEVTRMYGVQLQSQRMTPKWPVVQVADPVTIEVDRPLGVEHDNKVALVLPDPQIGYRFYDDTGEYDPFHDEAALDIALQIAEDVQPDLVVWLGDFLDLAPFGRYEQEAAFAHTTQRAINYGYQLLAKFQAVLPLQTEQVVIEGNHDRRLEKMVTANAMAAFGLKRAEDVSGWPVLSVPSLCRFDDLGIEYVGGYPAGEYWINERLKCVHGDKVRSGGSTALAVANDERVSTIFGHIHRIETQYKTSGVYGGGRVRLAHSPGCLCRIDGAVPGVRGSTDLSGRPVTRYEDWQQGLTVVSYQSGDAPFSLESVFINSIEGHSATYGGVTYTPR